MKIIRSLDEITSPPQRTVATLGNFDGVHLGHREIFRRVVQRARELGGTATVITFSPHPLKLLAPRRAPLLINTYAERERLIAASCVDLLVTLPFTRELAALSAEEFTDNILVKGLGVQELIIGYDYAFGRDRLGDAGFLRRAGERYGFSVEELSPISRQGLVYSSTRIRNLLLAGEVEAAAELLGRHFTLEGEVVRGEGRGKGLGFPTANIRTEKEILPRDGVYAVKVRRGNTFYDAVANIGNNPTFGNAETTTEVHLLDCNDNLYGESLRIYFLHRLRDERTFVSADALRQAIVTDIEQARILLAESRVIEFREYLGTEAGCPEVTP